MSITIVLLIAFLVVSSLVSTVILVSACIVSARFSQQQDDLPAPRPGETPEVRPERAGEAYRYLSTGLDWKVVCPVSSEIDCMRQRER